MCLLSLTIIMLDTLGCGSHDMYKLARQGAWRYPYVMLVRGGVECVCLGH
jgi:hypothetical protein